MLVTNKAIPAHVRSLVGLLSEQTLRLLREAVGDRGQGPLFAPSGQRMSRGAIATQVRNTTRYSTHDIRPDGPRDLPQRSAPKLSLST